MSNSVYEVIIFDLNGVIIQANWPTPEDSMLKLVERVKNNGLKVAVLSNLGLAAAQNIQEQKWAEMFDVLGFSGEIGYGKPDKRAFTAVAQMLKIEPVKCLFVDDDEYRLSGAKEIGMSVHLFRNQRTLEQELKILAVLG